MTEEVAKVFIVVATGCGVAIVIGSLMRENKSWADWSLFGGAILLTIGLGLTTLVAFDLSRWLNRHGQYPCLGSIGLGVVFFTMGFVMDQLRHRAIQRYRKQLTAMEESNALLSAPPPTADE